MLATKFFVYFHEKIPEAVKKTVMETAITTFNNIDFEGISGLPFSIRFAYNHFRGQFNGVKILNKAISQGYKLFLFIIPYDLYVPHLNFVFGVAQPYYGAIISTWRLRIANSTDVFLTRVKKTVKHELGHVFGLPHCANPCVMRFANSLLELDLKPPYFCEKCKRMLMQVGVIKS